MNAIGKASGWIMIVTAAAATWSIPVSSPGATLQVSIPTIRVSGATAGTEFDVPISVQIPEGLANQGLARLYVRVVSTGSANMIAPVAAGTKVQTTWAEEAGGFDVKFGAFLRDLDGDGDTDAGDTAVVDLGSNTNCNLGIGSATLVLTQRWRFVGTPAPGTSYALHVAFPTTKSRYYNGTGTAAPFDTQVSVDGSVQVQSPRIPGDADGSGTVDFADFAILQNNYGQSGKTFDDGDFNGDDRVTFEDFSILQNHYGQTDSSPAPAAAMVDAGGVACMPLGLLILAAGGLAALLLNRGSMLSIVVLTVGILGTTGRLEASPDIAVSIWSDASNSFTLVADGATLTEKAGYTPLTWSGLKPQTVVSGDKVFIGAGQFLTRYRWDGTTFTQEARSTGWGEIVDLAVAGNGDIIVCSRANETAHYTFVADPITLAEKSGYAPLAWGPHLPEAVTAGLGGGESVWIGAGQFLFRYTWDGFGFTEQGYSTGWGVITDLALAGNGDLLINSKPNSTASFTFVADPATLAEKSSYTSIIWGGAEPQMATRGPGGGDTFWFGAGPMMYRYEWNGSEFAAKLVSAPNWGNIIDIKILPAAEIAGDVNHDGTVDSADLDVLADHWGEGPGATWEMGDVSKNGYVESLDLDIVAANWGLDG